MILLISTLVQAVRQYAEHHPQDFGWHSIKEMEDSEIEEVIRDNNCTTVVETIAALQNVATAFNED